MVSCSSHQMDI